MSKIQELLSNFNSVYKKPRLEGITVGFSGIDPDEKSFMGDGTITHDQLEAINQLILNYLSNLQIRVDTGNVDPSAEEPEISYINLKPSEIPHEALAELLGGDENGHYHLTERELEKLKAIIAKIIPIGDEVEIDHETLKNLLGGDENGHYHLTNEEREKLLAMIAEIIPNDEIQKPHHEELRGLLGGDANGHYHLTQSEHDRLKQYPTYAQLQTSLYHNYLQGLQGGQAGEYYHFTAKENEQLKKLIEEFIPDGENIDIPDADDHEQLFTLLGGNASGHYHLTGEQLSQLVVLLNVVFPSGGTTPASPESWNLTPVTPVTPGEESGEGDVLGGLPIGTPPGWSSLQYPNGFTAWPNDYRAYYGSVSLYGSTDSLNATFFTKGLLVPMLKIGATGGSVDPYFYLTDDLVKWQDRYISVTGTAAFVTVHDYYYMANARKNGLGALFVAGDLVTNTTSTGKPFCRIAYQIDKGTNRNFATLSASGSAYKPTTCYTAFVFDPVHTKLLCITSGGQVSVIPVSQQSLIFEKNILGNIGITVNPACAAFSPVTSLACVTGPDGTAKSDDGLSWVVNTAAPHGLKDLTYREDLGCFMALGTNKLFYVSTDGFDWQLYNTKPIPLDTVSHVEYAADIGWYCAVGGAGKTAYFSKNLKSWVGTTITNGADVDMSSVIYMPSTKKFVLMPKSGSSFYTFDTTQWTNV